MSNLNSRQRRRNHHVTDSTTTKNNGWIKTTPYGDWRDYHIDPYAEVIANQLHHLIKCVPYSINKKRLGSKPWYKLILLQKMHQW